MESKPARDGDTAGSSSRGGCWGSLISRPIGEGGEAVNQNLGRGDVVVGEATRGLRLLPWWLQGDQGNHCPHVSAPAFPSSAGLSSHDQL